MGNRLQVPPGAGGDDIVARFGDGLDRHTEWPPCPRPAPARQSCLPARPRAFQHVGGRVHDAGVDIAQHLQVEQIGAVLGANEGVAGGLVLPARPRPWWPGRYSRRDGDGLPVFCGLPLFCDETTSRSYPEWPHAATVHGNIISTLLICSAEVGGAGWQGSGSWRRLSHHSQNPASPSWPEPASLCLLATPSGPGDGPWML